MHFIIYINYGEAKMKQNEEVKVQYMDNDKKIETHYKDGEVVSRKSLYLEDPYETPDENSNWLLRSTSEYKKNKQNKIEEVRVRYHSISTMKSCEERFVDTYRQGVMTIWNEDGTKHGERHYKDDVLTKMVTWDKDENREIDLALVW